MRKTREQVTGVYSDIVQAERLALTKWLGPRVRARCRQLRTPETVLTASDARNDTKVALDNRLVWREQDADADTPFHLPRTRSLHDRG